MRTARREKAPGGLFLAKAATKSRCLGNGQKAIALTTDIHGIIPNARRRYAKKTGILPEYCSYPIQTARTLG
ncbi:hypothetical protein ACDP63_16015 [Paracoccus sp. P2]|uniref:hypothetical protein n=1 Tax=Paracoccus sp. P2 TaxID=3248840 RepID=UPI00391FC706